ncbi:MAG: HAD-IA family hydrolase [Nocardiaceae bacterium]|nr:HAD-IA family hydrolase [Nocardiaceae bacterium]
MRALDAVIFDVDGTLVDSERDGHRVAFNLAFAEAGLPDRWDVELYGELLAVAGGAKRLTHWFERTSTPNAAELSQRLHRRKTEFLRELIAEGRIEARPGVADLLDELEAAGVTLHVATTGTRAWVEPLLARTFGNRFSIIITGDDVAELKPHPEAYLEVLRRSGTAVDRVVAIEDSANGVRAAIAAGLECVAVRNRYTRLDDVTGATLVADSFTENAVHHWFRDRLA